MHDGRSPDARRRRVVLLVATLVGALVLLAVPALLLLDDVVRDRGAAAGQTPSAEAPGTPGGADDPDGSDDPARILLVGDSVTQGAAGDWTWRYRLAQTLDAAGTPYDFVGYRDDLYDGVAGGAWAQAYLDPAFDRDHAAKWGMTFADPEVPVGELVTQERPDVVVVLLGINDLLQGATPEAVAASATAFVGDARDADPDVDVVLAHVPQTWVPGVPETNALLDEVAAVEDDPGARVVATSTPRFSMAPDTWDDVHPSTTGEAWIADAVADALAEVGVGDGADPEAQKAADLATGPRQAPTVTATPLPGAVSLAWMRPPGVTAYQLVVRDDVSGVPLSYQELAPTTTVMTVPGLVPGRDYSFALRPVRGHLAAADDAVAVAVVRARPSA